jgi:hypothetical protein
MYWIFLPVLNISTIYIPLLLKCTFTKIKIKKVTLLHLKKKRPVFLPMIAVCNGKRPVFLPMIAVCNGKRPVFLPMIAVCNGKKV